MVSGKSLQFCNLDNDFLIKNCWVAIVFSSAKTFLLIYRSQDKKLMLYLLKKFVNGYYGSKRGLLNSVKYRALASLGLYRSYRNIEWERVKRLVFVCHGNICRSPLAEIYADSCGVQTCSYGLYCKDNRTADPRAQNFALVAGLDLKRHKTTNIKHYEEYESDLIVAMEPCHIKMLREMTAGRAQLTTLGMWLERPNPYIHDPYCANETFFERCENLVISGVDNLLKNIS